MNPQAFGPEPPAPDMKRLLLTVVICTAMISLWQMFNPPVQPQPDEAAPPAAPAAAVAASDDVTASADAADATPLTLPERLHTVTADVAANGTALEGVKGGYRATLSNRGAQLQGFELTGYLDSSVKEASNTPNIDLVRGMFDGGRLFAVRSRDGDVKLSAADAYEVVEQSESAATYRRTLANGVVVTRRFRFEPARFAFAHEITLENKGTVPRKAVLDLVLTGAERAGERDGGGAFASQTDQLAAVCRVAGEHERFPSQELEEQPEAMAGQVDYVGLDRHFFLATVLPDAGVATSGCVVRPWQQGQGAGATVGLTVSLEHAPVELQPGASVTLGHTAFFGPKQLDLLQQFGGHLEENVDFGWFGVLSRPMLWVLVKLYENLGNFGIAIILLTLLMKLLTFPLTQKSYVSMQQMKTVAPELKKLQQKYANDRATLGQKQMDLYKERGINPMAGCFPMLVQMPIWFALYRTLWSSVELYQQPFYGWIADLSQPDVSPLFGWPLLPLIVGVLMLGQTLMQPPPEDQPQMKYVMWGMPIMFTFFMLQMPSGLSLYMITNSVLTMAQQGYIKRKYK
ncbi:MAG: membrane protein insertase YidC [Myxococcota bacterium]